jgi:hypothetical protein
LGRLVIDRDEPAAAQLAAEPEAAAAVGPTDAGDEAGPTAGAEDPDLPGSDEPVAADVTKEKDAGG